VMTRRGVTAMCHCHGNVWSVCLSLRPTISAYPGESGGSAELADPPLFVMGGQLMVLRPPLLSDHSDEYCRSDETIHIRTLQPYNNSNTKSVKYGKIIKIVAFRCIS